MKADKQKPAAPSIPSSDLVRVLVGPEEQEFMLSRKTLYTASPFFRTHLGTSGPSTLRLPSTLPSTFELFTLHLHHPRTFTTFIATSIATLDPETCTHPSAESSRLSLHWTLVHLHLFGASITLPSLQDAAMDAIQDLYLHYDWEVSPSFTRFLYAADPVQARRLRKWAVAMVAWSIALAAHVSPAWQGLMEESDEFRREYASHLNKMAGIRSRGVDVRVKNPQLRLPRNGLRSEERYFGFRLCSFHSHRGVVGEGECLHTRTGVKSDAPDVEGWYDVVDLETRGEREGMVAEVPLAPIVEMNEPGTRARKPDSDRDRLKPSEPREKEREPDMGQSRTEPHHQGMLAPPKEKERKPSPVSMLILDGFYLDVS